MERKTTTIPIESFKSVSELKPEEQGIAWVEILKSFFYGIPIDYENLPDAVRGVIAGIMPTMRKIQSKFVNGSCKKINISKKQADSDLLTKAKLSESKQKNVENLAFSEDENSSIYNNININNKNIYNNQPTNLKDEEELENETEYFFEDLTKFYFECCIENLNKILEYAIEKENLSFILIEQKTRDFLERVKNETSKIIINKLEKSASQVLSRYLEIFRAPENDVIQRLEYLFDMLTRDLKNKNITNTYKYQVALFYNHALDI